MCVVNNPVYLIVPVYNTEKYLRRCLNSIRDQTYKNIEVILVDDGSPDNCPKICNEYAAKDSRFHVIHKENGGVSSARNAGLDYLEKSSGGGYIGFVDSDDWLPKDSVAELLYTIERENTDLSCGNQALFFGTKLRTDNTMESIASVKKTDIFAFSKFLQQMGDMPSVYAKMYRLSVIRRQHIRFPEHMSLSEDNIFLYKYLDNCDSVSSTKNQVYYYNRITGSSLTHSLVLEANSFWSNALLERQKFLPKHLPASEQCNIIRAFEIALSYYATRLSDTEALSKVAETCRLFEPLLKRCNLAEIGETESSYVSAYISQLSFLQSENYAELYYMVIKQMAQGNGSRWKQVIRWPLLSLMEVLVFRCNLFYH